jgi:transposase
MAGQHREQKQLDRRQSLAWLQRQCPLEPPPWSAARSFRNATNAHAPQAAILFDKFHVIRHLGDALDQVRKSEYARVSGKQRRFIKGQKYTLLSRKENLTLEGRQALKTLLRANKRLNTAYLLKESFGQLWSYEHEGWGDASSRTGAHRSNGRG